MFKFWQSLAFWKKVLLAFGLGIILGMIAPEVSIHFKILGDIFIAALKLLVVPLILVAIVRAIVQLEAGSQALQLGLRTISLFLLTAIFASAIGLTIAQFVEVEPLRDSTPAAAHDVRNIPPFSEVVLNVIPKNPFAALAEGKILQIVLLAIMIGVAIRKVGEPAEPIKQLFLSGYELMLQITRWVLSLTPIGVFGLIAWVVGHYGLATLAPLAGFIAAIYIACILHMVLVYGALVWRAGLSPVTFFRKVFSTQLVAYSTCSSFGTLPVAHQTATQQLRIRDKIASFVLPLGSTINMDGCGGIYPAIAAVFIAQLYGVPLDSFDYFLIAATATLASIGTAGVPGTAMIMLTVTLNVVGLPLEGIAFIAAIDRVIDMIRTATNVTGDLAVSYYLNQRLPSV